MAKQELVNRTDLQAVTRADFLYQGQVDPQGWSNPADTFARWRNVTLLTFILLVVITIVGVPLSLLNPRSFWPFLLVTQWAVAYTVLCFIKGYLDDGIFEQQVRYAFQRARESVRPEEWVLWLGRAYDLVRRSPVMFRRMNPWEIWVTGPNNPAHFDWILDRLKDLGIFVHESFPKAYCRGADLALERRYYDALDSIIGKVDGLKIRWMWSVETVLHITLSLFIGSIFLAGGSLHLIFGGR